MKEVELAPVRSAARCYQTTGLQRAMVLASLKRAAAQPYHQQLVVAFREPIDSAAMVCAVETCFARHAGLMARFEFRGRELFQSQIGMANIAIKELDSSGEPVTCDERLNNFLAADATVQS